MKKFSLMIGAAAVAAVATAAEPSWVIFSSEGPDCYADGTEVMDGEYYALIYSEGPNSVFKGFDTTGKLIDDVQDTIVGMAPLAENHACRPVLFVVDKNGQNPYTNGVFEVYLLDTRVKAQDGTVTVAERDPDTGDFVSVGGYEPVKAQIKSNTMTNLSSADALDGSGAIETGLPAEFNQPTITGFTVNELDDQVVVTVTNTVPSVRYTVAGGQTLDGINATKISGVNGAKDGKELNLVFPEPQLNRFFKVVRGK